MSAPMRSHVPLTSAEIEALRAVVERCGLVSTLRAAVKLVTVNMSVVRSAYLDSILIRAAREIDELLAKDAHERIGT